MILILCNTTNYLSSYNPNKRYFDHGEIDTKNIHKYGRPYPNNSLIHEDSLSALYENHFFFVYRNL